MKDFWDKLDVSGKFINGVIIALLILLGSRVANDFAEKMKKADLQKSLISDLTDKDSKVRRDIALITLDYAFPHDDSNVVADIAERIYQEFDGKNIDSLYKDSIEYNTAFRIVKERCPSRAKDLVKIKTTQFIQLDANKREYSKPDTISTNVDTTTGKFFVTQYPILFRQLNAIYNKRILIQYQGDTNNCHTFTSLCRAKGWLVPPVEIIPNTNKVVQSIRYFHYEDKSTCDSIRRDIQKTLVIRYNDIKILYLGKKYPNIPLGQIEVWIKK